MTRTAPLFDMSSAPLRVRAHHFSDRAWSRSILLSGARRLRPHSRVLALVEIRDRDRTLPVGPLTHSIVGHVQALAARYHSRDRYGLGCRKPAIVQL